MSDYGTDKYVTDHGEYDQVRWWEEGPVPEVLRKWLASRDIESRPTPGTRHDNRAAKASRRPVSPASQWLQMVREGVPVEERMAFLRTAYPRIRPRPPIQPNVRVE